MPPKYSTRRHKYKNKNAKTNKLRKQKKKGSFAQLRNRRIDRPDEVTFNDSERIEFVTGFAKRKQQRRIKAAKDLMAIEHEQHINTRRERRDVETNFLVKGGHIKDPIKMFLGEDYNDDSSDTDIDGMNESESSNSNDTESEIECEDIEQRIKYEQDDAVTTTVISAIHTQMDDVFEENEEENDFMDEQMTKWLHTKDKNEDGKLSVYEQRKEEKKKIEIQESKKKHQKKIKKMMKFVKEFQRNKKRRANGKTRKKKIRSSKKGRR